MIARDKRRIAGISPTVCYVANCAKKSELSIKTTRLVYISQTLIYLLRFNRKVAPNDIRHKVAGSGMTPWLMKPVR